ncbi:hypothetical protein ITJ57_00080 [Plantibacter sp. VKM Ac-2880]|uniref:hypothetical protein n=1 Tax=Plantibacter sp. VKM Ac-2880 TaxID=2783827 RepID=UPI00188EECBB|nr:hypothetical protein [Plantibacter sp. VKM Ac-2880]MBF4567147.1 hypothetical protein [Plantibacter sp. VKM Ac-2880]
MGDVTETMCSVDRGAEDATAVLEGRARCLEDVLFGVNTELFRFVQARAGQEWVGSAATQFSWSADELTTVLREAASALDEGLRSTRGAASSMVDGGGA